MEEKNPNNTKISPKFIPIKCVVCNGFGTVTNLRRTCHGCDGKGYILVPTEETQDAQPTD